MICVVSCCEVVMLHKKTGARDRKKAGTRATGEVDFSCQKDYIKTLTGCHTVTERGNNF